MADAVTAALAERAGAIATVDDSSLTGCVGGPAPQPLAYRNDRIVLRTTQSNSDAQTAVRQALNHIGAPGIGVGAVERISFPAPEGGEPVVPVLSVTLDNRTDGPTPVVALARHLRGHHGSVAGMDYLGSPSGGPTGMWPFGFPKPATTLPVARAAGLGAGITIAVYDTGVAPAGQVTRPSNASRLTPGDTETLDGDVPPDGTVDLYYGGHFTAISHVLATIAPAAAVEAVRISEPDGVVTDVSATRRMAATLHRAKAAGAWPDLIVTAFGSEACDRDPLVPGAELEPLGLQAVTEAVDRFNQTIIVAASGNRSTNRRFYPAAFPGVIAVGGLDTTVDPDGNAWTSASRTGPLAEFSNYGPWVDAYVSAVDLTVGHVIGLKFGPDEPVLNGIADVSGTSYGAPLLAGEIAERMSLTGESAAQAWDAIRVRGVPCSAAAGRGVAVALTSMAAAATDKGIGPSAC